jgi:predicted ribosome quality control (RQC) complex YloA/Tae2 family protein
MNHLNCFVIEAIAKQLQIRTKGSVLLDCFSNSPDEIIFIFNTGSLKCLFFQAEIYFTFDDTDSSKSRLFKPQFTELIESQILDVQAHQFERSFQMNFDSGFILVFKCHGRKSNILLFDKSIFSDMFRKNLENDALLKLDSFCNRVPDFLTDGFALTFDNLKRSCPFLPYEIYENLNQNFALPELQEKLNDFHAITAFDVNHSGELSPVYKRSTLFEDISKFSRQSIKSKRYVGLTTELSDDLLKKINDKKLFIESNKTALINIENKRSDEEIGNIILANLHLIPNGSKKVIVLDIYNNQNIEIKLDDQLSAVNNASKYFKKAKGVPHTIRLLTQKIEQAQKVLQELESKYELLIQSKEWKDLKPLMKVISKNETETDLPYRKFNEQGFEILVGKNAESNEKILNYYSDKDDIWLHAKDVSGSHVLIKCSKNKKLPEPVLHRAAALAAYYSKNRNQNLATVTYTFRKYVRKIKGAEKGKVSVSQEETILVKPSLN